MVLLILQEMRKEVRVFEDFVQMNAGYAVENTL
jgi:hypothetical protein